MAIVFDGPVLPDDLIEFTRNVPLPAEVGDGLEQILPNRYIDNNEVDYANVTKTGRVARFRMYDGPLHVAQRDSATVNKVKLPPVSDSLSVGELERLEMEFARTGGTNQAAIVRATPPSSRRTSSAGWRWRVVTSSATASSRCSPPRAPSRRTSRSPRGTS
jgi:hypothetical protein